MRILALKEAPQLANSLRVGQSVTQMASAPHGPQQLKDRLVQSRVHRERDQFIASITEDQVLALASSHHNATPCSFFNTPKRGSYNICYFVQFPDGLKWVVRVPLAPCLSCGGRSKLESEVATMQYVILGSPQ